MTTRSERHQKLGKNYLFVLVPLLVIIAVVGWMSTNLAKAGEREANPVSTKQKQLLPSETVRKASKTVASSKSATSEQTKKATIESTEQSTEKNLTMLQKGRNHNQKASEYAYSAEKIQAIMDGRVTPMTGKRICFLTFDDGVNSTITPKILDVLKQEGVPATFFVVGNTISTEMKPILKRQITEGHGIAMHSFYHDYDLLYPGRSANPTQILKEATDTQKALQQILGEDFYSGVWRYPGGHMSWDNIAAGDQVLAEQKIFSVDWNAMSGDAQPIGDRPLDAQSMAAYQANSTTEYPDVHLRVVLMHDAMDKETTVQALPEIIRFYKEHEFIFGILE